MLVGSTILKQLEKVAGLGCMHVVYQSVCRFRLDVHVQVVKKKNHETKHPTPCISSLNLESAEQQVCNTEGGGDALFLEWWILFCFAF